MVKFKIMRFVILCFILFLVTTIATGQIKASKIFTANPTYGQPTGLKQNWKINLSNVEASNHVYSIPKEKIHKMKLAIKNQLPQREDRPINRNNSNPVLGVNFEGNLQ
ncbi:MAG: hypothetical protein RLZZ546_1538, partial [Bacteroidota bacterium]